MIGHNIYPMPLIIEAMENGGIKRIITIGTAGILQSRTTPNSLRYQSSESKQKSTRAAISYWGKDLDMKLI